MTGFKELTKRQSLRLFSLLGALGFGGHAGMRESLASSGWPAEGSKPAQDALNSCHFYPDIGELDCGLFALPADGLDEPRRRQALQQMETYLLKQKQLFLGFQGNQSQSYARELSFLLDMHANNIADPFQNSHMTANTKVMERAVLDYVATLWHARHPGEPSNEDDPSSYWGYVLSMGSTEGNLFGLWNARDYLAGRALFREPGGEVSCVAAPAPREQPNAYRPVAFYSQDTHYSIIKVLRTLAIDSFCQLGEAEYPGQCPFNGGRWPLAVPSQGGGEGPGAIDIGKLTGLVAFFAQRGHPIIVVLNYGTTFKGAYDDVRAAGEALEPILRQAGLFERTVAYGPGRCDIRTGYWIHVDAALGGAYMPFLKMAKERGLIQDAGPDFDFALPYVHSIVMSGHKWLGAPVPCGVFMTRRKYQLKPPDDPEYIGALDTTFAGSRSALNPAILWCYFARTSHDEQIRKAVRAETLAAYAFEQLSALDRQKGGRLWVERTPLSLAIRFRAPAKEIIARYSLAVETSTASGEKRVYAHIYIMDHVTKALIGRLLEDLSQNNAYAFDKA
jgi:histidine decarboxylase